MTQMTQTLYRLVRDSAGNLSMESCEGTRSRDLEGRVFYGTTPCAASRQRHRIFPGDMAELLIGCSEDEAIRLYIDECERNAALYTEWAAAARAFRETA